MSEATVGKFCIQVEHNQVVRVIWTTFDIFCLPVISFELAKLCTSNYSRRDYVQGCM